MIESETFDNEFKLCGEDDFQICKIFDSDIIYKPENSSNIKENELKFNFNEDNLKCTYIKEKYNNEIQQNHDTLIDSFINDDRSNTSNDSASQLVTDFFNQAPNQPPVQFSDQFYNTSLQMNISPTLSPNQTSLYSPPCHISNNDIKDTPAFQINSFIPQPYVEVTC